MVRYWSQSTQLLMVLFYFCWALIFIFRYGSRLVGKLPHVYQFYRCSYFNEIFACDLFIIYLASSIHPDCRPSVLGWSNGAPVVYYLAVPALWCPSVLIHVVNQPEWTYMVAMDEPSGKRNLVKNINAQHKIFNRPTVTETLGLVEKSTFRRI